MMKVGKFFICGVYSMNQIAGELLQIFADVYVDLVSSIHLVTSHSLEINHCMLFSCLTNLTICRTNDDYIYISTKHLKYKYKISL